MRTELHLKLYHEDQRGYLVAVSRAMAAQAEAGIKVQTLRAFSAPDDPDGYNDTSISGDIISELYMEFGSSRKEESEAFLKTTSGSLYPYLDIS